MGNHIALKTVTYEKYGWQLGHNEKPPDTQALDEDATWILVNPSKSMATTGSFKALMEHLSDDPEDIAWRARHA